MSDRADPEPVPTASLASLGFRLARLLWLAAWCRAMRVLTTGDCLVH